MARLILQSILFLTLFSTLCLSAPQGSTTPRGPVGLSRGSVNEEELHSLGNKEEKSKEKFDAKENEKQLDSSKSREFRSSDHDSKEDSDESKEEKKKEITTAKARPARAAEEMKKPEIESHEKPASPAVTVKDEHATKDSKGDVKKEETKEKRQTPEQKNEKDTDSYAQLPPIIHEHDIDDLYLTHVSLPFQNSEYENYVHKSSEPDHHDQPAPKPLLLSEELDPKKPGSQNAQ